MDGHDFAVLWFKKAIYTKVVMLLISVDSVLFSCRRIFIIIDSRRGVMDSDHEMMLTLNKAQMPYQVLESYAFFKSLAYL